MATSALWRAWVPSALFLVLLAVVLLWLSAWPLVVFFEKLPDFLKQAVYLYLGITLVLLAFAAGTLGRRRWAWRGLLVTVSVVAAYCAYVVAWALIGLSRSEGPWWEVMRAPLFALVCGVVVLYLLAKGGSTWLAQRQ